MDKTKFLAIIRGQEHSTDLWLSEFTKYRDIPSRLNAACAMGKMLATLQIHTSFSELEQWPEDEYVIGLWDKYSRKWDELYVAT